jgi:phosphoserine phosphatase
MIRVVVSDFDGPLADSNRVKEVCLHRAVAGLCGGVAALAAARKRGGDRYQIFEDVARKLSTTSDVEAIASHARVLVNTYRHCCAMGIIAAAERRGARHALAALSRRGLRIWVLSANARPLSDRVVAQTRPVTLVERQLRIVCLEGAGTAPNYDY